jgi:hypothetical protein
VGIITKTVKAKLAMAMGREIMVHHTASLFHFTGYRSTFGFWHPARHGMNWKVGCHNLS